MVECYLEWEKNATTREVDVVSTKEAWARAGHDGFAINGREGPPRWPRWADETLPQHAQTSQM